jgi:Exocyst complex component Sec5
MTSWEEVASQEAHWTRAVKSAGRAGEIPPQHRPQQQQKHTNSAGAAAAAANNSSTKPNEEQNSKESAKSTEKAAAELVRAVDAAAGSHSIKTAERGDERREPQGGTHPAENQRKAAVADISHLDFDDVIERFTRDAAVSALLLASEEAGEDLDGPDSEDSERDSEGPGEESDDACDANEEEEPLDEVPETGSAAAGAGASEKKQTGKDKAPKSDKKKKPAKRKGGGEGDDDSSSSDDDFVAKRAEQARLRRAAAQAAKDEKEEKEAAEAAGKAGPRAPKPKPKPKAKAQAKPKAKAKPKKRRARPAPQRKKLAATDLAVEDPLLAAEKFDVDKYLSGQLAGLSMADLKLQVERWHKQQESRAADLKELIKENFDEFVQARNTLDVVHAHMMRMRSNTLDMASPHTGANTTSAGVVSSVRELADVAAEANTETQQLAHAYSLVRARAEGIYRELVTDTEKVQATQNVLTVLQRFQSLFDLPRSLEQHMRRGQTDDVIRLVHRAHSMRTVLLPPDLDAKLDEWLRSGAESDSLQGKGSVTERVFLRVFGHVARLSNRYQEGLRKRLRDPWLSTQRQEDAVRALVALFEVEASAIGDRADRAREAAAAGAHAMAAPVVMGEEGAEDTLQMEHMEQSATTSTTTSASGGGKTGKLKNFLHMRRRHGGSMSVSAKDGLVVARNSGVHSVEASPRDPHQQIAAPSTPQPPKLMQQLRLQQAAAARTAKDLAGVKSRTVATGASTLEFRRNRDDLGQAALVHPALILLTQRTNMLCKHFQRSREDPVKKLAECGGYFQQDFPQWWGIAQRWILEDADLDQTSIWRDTGSTMRQRVASLFSKIVVVLSETVRGAVAKIRRAEFRPDVEGVERFGRATSSFFQLRSLVDDTLRSANNSVVDQIDLLHPSNDLTECVTAVSEAFVFSVASFVQSATRDIVPVGADAPGAVVTLERVDIAEQFRSVVRRVVTVVLEAFAPAPAAQRARASSLGTPKKKKPVAPILPTVQSTKIQWAPFSRQTTELLRLSLREVMILPMLTLGDLIRSHFVLARAALEASDLESTSSLGSLEDMRKAGDNTGSRELLLCLAHVVFCRGVVFPKLVHDFIADVNATFKGSSLPRGFDQEVKAAFFDAAPDLNPPSPLDAMDALCSELADAYRARTTGRICALIRRGALESGINWAELSSEPTYCSDYVSMALLSCVFVHAELREVLAFAIAGEDRDSDSSSEFRHICKKYGPRAMLSQMVLDVLRGVWLPVGVLLREPLTDNYNGAQQFLADAEFFVKVLRPFAPRWSADHDKRAKSTTLRSSPMSMLIDCVSGVCADVVPDVAVKRRGRAVARSMHRTQLLFQCFGSG